jgi:MFS transporter, OFA family, oxalate/formate antiporter
VNATDANAIASTSPVVQTGGLKHRWVQLVIGIICMAMVANLQYGWTLFVNPMSDRFGWTKAAIQVAFTIFVLCETWLVPVEGYLMDRFGPRPVVLVGGILAGLSWVMNSYATSLGFLYFAAIIGGVGAGAVYGTCVGNALKWFPDRRGLAAGLTAAGFGAGAALTVIPIANMVKSGGYDRAFFDFGLIQGIVVVVLSLFLIKPPVRNLVTAVKGAVNPQSRRDFRPHEMLKTNVFWLLYICMVLVASGGLLAAAEVGPIAKDFGVDKIPMWWFGTTTLLTVALSIDSLVNGLTRPLTGFISDHLGRENTMVLVFVVEGLAIWGLMKFGHSAAGFLIFAPLIFLGYGEIFSLFPAAAGDSFGVKYAATNNGLLYTAKGTASILIPLASVLRAHSAGGWAPVLWLAGALPIIAAALALWVLAPMRRRMLERVAAEEADPGRATERKVGPATA